MRMRPLNKDEEEGDLIVQKSSSDSLSIVGQTFTFDSVADVKSTQVRLVLVFDFCLMKMVVLIHGILIIFILVFAAGYIPTCGSSFSGKLSCRV